MTDAEKRYLEARKARAEALFKYQLLQGTPAGDEAWQEARRAYWKMRKAIRDVYAERQMSCENELSVL
jgi:hypothetical protein